jgi:hypothetical protein
MSEDPKADRKSHIDEAIQAADFKDSLGEHFTNLLGRLERDDEALIVLKGHLVIEERITAAIFWHGEFIERARLTFAHKMQLARAISMDHHQNTMWDLIDKLNAVRNKLAHSLDGEPRAKAMTALREAFKREVSHAAKEELEDDVHLLMSVISLCLGWTHTFEQEVERFKEYVNMMDRVLNPHRHNKTPNF